MVYKIADLYIDIDTDSPEIRERCSAYLCEDYPQIDLRVSVSEEDYLKELPVDILNPKKHETMVMYAKFNAIYRKICNEILKHDGFLMHGVLIEYKGIGYIFTAKSGTGKTTHTNLWNDVFGDEVHVINGDKPLIRIIGDKIYAYGTPWCGKEGINMNTSVELKNICFIERGETNIIKKLDADTAAMHIFSQVMIVDSSDLGKQLELIDKLLCKVTAYLLKCNMEPEAAKVAYNGMQKAVQ